MPTPSRFETIFEAGRQRYEKRAGRPLDPTLVVSLKTIADLRGYIESQNGSFETFRNKDKIIYAKLNMIFTPIERLGNCVAAPLSAGSPPVGACFGAVAVLIKSAQDVSTHYDRIMELFEIMGAVMDRFELHDIDRITPQLEENFANVLATVLEMIALSTKAVERKRWKEYMAKIWKGQNEQMEQLRQRLDQLVRDGTSMVVEQTNSSVNRIEAQTANANTHIERIGNHTKHLGLDILNIKDTSREIMDMLLQQHSTRKDNDLYDILKSTQTNTDRMEAIRRERVADTGLWLFQEPAFQSWLNGTEPLLWVCGSPGSGKTYLASAAVTMLLSRIAGGAGGGNSTAAGFFFFKQDDVSCLIGGFHQALRDVAWQITRFDADYADHVASECRSWADVETVPSAWRKLFTRYFSVKGRTLHLVFDGIDETEEGGDRGCGAFLKLLPDIQGPDSANIRILILGRPHLTNSIRIAAYNQHGNMVTISVEAHKNRQDLRRYIERGVARLQLGGASASLEKVIRDTLEAKAEGMFLWVRLMLNVLEVQSTEQEILHVLNTAPTDIEGMVREVLKVYSSTLKGREAEEFNTILAWISFAARPLTLAELDVALRRAAPSGGPVLSLEAKLREKFGSVITLVRDDGLSTGMLQSRIQSPGDSVAFDSKYETTSIGFAHASIAEYFRKGEGKFAARKTYPKIGVVYAEAHACLLKSCLEVFVAPGEGESKKAAAALKTYARDHWYNHLQCSVSQPFDTIDQIELLKTLFSFLNEPDVLRGWCEGTPWTFYNEEAATVLCSCIESWYQYESTEINAGIRSWIKTSSRQKAEFIFLPAAKINGEQGLHRDGFGDDWPPLPAITSVVQIRALIEDDDTLDTLPYPPPLETLLKAVRWLRLEENAVYNRKLAICLRNLEYVAESIPYFEKALQLDEAYVPARSGLAIIYRKQGYFTKALELELTNATYLTQQLKSRGNNEGITKELGRSYGLIAYCYGKIDNKAAAMRYWRLAAKTTYIVKWGIYAYLRLLWTSPKDNRWSEIIWLLKSMEQAQDDKENYSRLTACILENAYPKETPDAFFRMLGRAAMEENCFSWLESVYHTAITQSKDHVTTIDLKMSLVELHRIFTEDMPGAERLIEELLEIACLDEESSIQQLERCKEKLGQDYCRICVRKSIHAAQDRVECDKYIARLTRLCRSGLEPRALRNKCTYNERSSLYLASLQRRYGDVTDAGLSLGPYLIESCHMALSPNPRTMRNGLQGLGDALIAMGMYNEAVSFLSATHSQVMWVCDSCRRSHSTDQGKAASICDVCLAAFCSNCGSELESGSFCVPGHSMVKVPASATLRGPSCDISFRGNVVPLKEAVKFILQEWQELFM